LTEKGEGERKTEQRIRRKGSRRNGLEEERKKDKASINWRMDNSRFRKMQLPSII
jgi:hypothetical protein